MTKRAHGAKKEQTRPLGLKKKKKIQKLDWTADGKAITTRLAGNRLEQRGWGPSVISMEGGAAKGRSPWQTLRSGKKKRSKHFPRTKGGV